jgi:hypothetical protein
MTDDRAVCGDFFPAGKWPRVFVDPLGGVQ